MQSFTYVSALRCVVTLQCCHVKLTWFTVTRACVERSAPKAGSESGPNAALVEQRRSGSRRRAANVTHLARAMAPRAGPDAISGHPLARGRDVQGPERGSRRLRPTQRTQRADRAVEDGPQEEAQPFLQATSDEILCGTRSTLGLGRPGTLGMPDTFENPFQTDLPDTLENLGNMKVTTGEAMEKPDVPKLPGSLGDVMVGSMNPNTSTRTMRRIRGPKLWTTPSGASLNSKTSPVNRSPIHSRVTQKPRSRR